MTSLSRPLAATASSDTGRGPSTPRGDALKTVATLGLLTCALPFNLALTGVALLGGAIRGRPEPRAPAGGRRTILISGAKMTKALALARAFHRDGHRVILVESGRYRFCGPRFSRAVDGFHIIPPASSPDYGAALVDIVRREHVDVYVPVCSPASAWADAQAKAALEEFCEVLHFDPQVLARLDDKQQFAETAAELGLAVPDAHRITQPEQVLQFDFADTAAHPPYVLKSIAYDPVRRLDLTPLPQSDPDRTRAFVAGLPISRENPWVMQSFVEGQEYCTHSTARDGHVQLHCCCESSAFQLNYAMVDIPEIEEWVRSFVAGLKLTGQVSLDFIRGVDGRYYAIECNPRTHSAITMFHDHPGVASAFLDRIDGTLKPTATSRPTYWLYHELWRALRRPRAAGGPLARIRNGKDAIFAWDDPLPFLFVHHLQIPSLLLGNLRRGGRWTKIDFNIGKLVEPGGD
jgi:predicted ATP-grasp superfamily ATP-dependent carboligase